MKAQSDDPFFGRMNDPTGAAIVRGPCGDEMEFYLHIKELELVQCFWNVSVRR